MFLPHEGSTFLRNVGARLPSEADSQTMQILTAVCKLLQAHKLDKNG